MPIRQFIALSLLGALVMTTAPARAADDPLANVRRAHPRLLFRDGDLLRLRELVKADPLMQQWHTRLRAAAERMLAEKPIEHILIGPRLLDKSRTAHRRISTLAGLYLIDGDKRFAERAKLEMLTAAAFADWNPSHFLDVAEMTNALAVGYDWLFDFLSPEEKATVRGAIIKLGLQAGLDGFDKKAWWTTATHNWSQVCNGGLTIGALALADEEPAIAGRLLPLCRKAIEPSMHAFAPDGGFGEGPGYWGYATQYNIYYLAALESALGTDWGLNKLPGFADTGFFRIQSIGPLGRTFNYADASDGAGSAPQMLWLARTFNQPAFAAHELKMVGNNPSIFHLLWYSQLPAELGQSKIENQKSPMPLDALFAGTNVAFFRSAFDDRQALFVGIKGGDNKTNHSHLDLGSFLLDAAGYRWAVDLGPDDYNLPGYFSFPQRWQYYRLNTRSHNTLTLDGQNQSPKAAARIIKYQSTPARAHVVIDLTEAYAPAASRVLRGLAMLERSRVLLQDEIESAQPVEIVWAFLTPAKIRIDGQSAILTQGDQTMTVKLLSPEGARFEIVSANPPAPQKQQPEIQNLTIRLREKSTRATIAVQIASGGGIPSATIVPLADWVDDGKLPK